MGEQEREMVRKANTMGEIRGVCLALRTLYNPKKSPVHAIHGARWRSALQAPSTMRSQTMPA